MPIECHTETFAERTVLRELVALATISAVWARREPPIIAAELADVLVGSLHLDFAFVRMCDPKGGAAIEVARGQAWETFAEWLHARLGDLGQFSHKEIVAAVGGAGPCRGVIIPIGVNSQSGLVAAACTRTDFPSEIDQLLLSIAANHAAAAFQTARLRTDLDAKVAELRQARSQLEVKVAERTAELSKSERYLAEAQKLTRTGSWAWNVRAGTLFWSQEIFRIYEYDPRETGPTWQQFLERVHPEDRPQIEQRAKMEASEKDWVESQTDFRILLPDGTVKHLHSIAHPVRDEAGEITEVVGTVMDISEQWEARTRLEKAFEEIRDLKDRLHHENLALRDQIDQAFMFEEILGSSPALQTVLSNIVKVAPTDSTVLITGETGTGKELIARAIHKHSHRSSRAFISVNCGSIPPSLIASELFGHEKGAFTGALQRRLGRFEMAHGGTIFLDEVGELPPETQVTLLRVLQERQFERVGGNRVLPTDVRVIAATNRDLAAAIAAGTFRSDLFYRLNVFPIEVPPLRRRKEDIPMLVEYFVKRYAEKTGKVIRKIDKSTLELCQSYLWPGNIRELQNIVERSVILSSGDTFWIEKAWLAIREPVREELPGLLPGTLQNREREIIEKALAESKGRVAGPDGAAAKLGIPRSTLDSKIRLLKIKKQNFIPEH